MNVVRSIVASVNLLGDMAHRRSLDSPAAVRAAPRQAPSQVVSAAASASPSPPRVARHLPDSVSTAPVRYTPELANDPLSMVAEYLSPTDQLVMRQVSPAVRHVVDAKISALSLSIHDACALFSEPGDLRHIRTLRLMMCGDADLVRFAEILASVGNTHFELSLHGQEGCQVTEIGLRSLRTLSLGGISLQDIQITQRMVEALSLGMSPVSITLPYWLADQAEPALISLIPRLTSLHATKLYLPDAAVASLRSHPCLSELVVGELSEMGFREMASSATLRKLTVQKIHGNEVHAVEAIADNQGLASLTIGRIQSAQSLLALSRNATLTSIDLGLSAAACSGIPAIANMQTLEHISLTRIMSRGRLASEHVEALCTRSLVSLRLHCWDMDLAAWTKVAAAHAGHLSLDFCDLNNDAIVTDIAANVWIASLSVYGEILSEGNVFILASSPSIEHLRVDFLSDRPDGSEARIKTEWRAAGKLPHMLDLTVSRVSLDAERVAWTMPC